MYDRLGREDQVSKSGNIQSWCEGFTFTKIETNFYLIINQGLTHYDIIMYTFNSTLTRKNTKLNTYIQRHKDVWKEGKIFSLIRISLNAINKYYNMILQKVWINKIRRTQSCCHTLFEFKTLSLSFNQMIMTHSRFEKEERHKFSIRNLVCGNWHFHKDSGWCKIRVVSPP